MAGIAPSRIFTGRKVELELPAPAVSWYRHGWQSWSLSCWHDAAAAVPGPRPRILQPMQTDPAHAEETGPLGSGVGAVRFGDRKVLLLGCLGLDARVWLESSRFCGEAEPPQAGSEPQWLVAYGDEDEVFAHYVEELGSRLGTAPSRATPKVWCSWYSFYTAIDEQALQRTLPALQRFPVDVIQIDDGWQISVGDWEPSDEFPSGMADLTSRIRAAGRTAGLWLAPLIAARSSRLAREHRDWLLPDATGRPVSAGFNWGEQLYALDTTVPEVQDWLARLMRTVRDWGFDYLKLDFLYGAALPGRRCSDVPREAAYREALGIMREAAGDAYLVACGAPILPSLGLCDALRIGPDVAGHWESPRDERLLANPAIPGMRTAIRTTVHRLWLRPLVALDPDVMYLSGTGNDLSDEERHLHQSLSHVCGFLATSDPPLSATDPPEAEISLAFSEPEVTKLGPYRYRVGNKTVDFAPALGLPGPESTTERLARAFVSWAGNLRVVMRLNNAVFRRHAKKTRARICS